MNVIGLKRCMEDGLIDENIRANQLFPALAVDEEKKIFLCSDKTLGFAFECEPLPGGDQKTQEKLEQLFSQNFPDDTLMQFFLYRSPDIDARLNAMQRMRTGYEHDLLTPVFKERISFLRHHSTESIISRSRKGAIYDLGKIVDLKLVISVKIPFKGSRPSEEAAQETLQWSNKLLSHLKSIGLQPVQLDATHYLRLMHSIVNWNKDATWKASSSSLWEEDKTLDGQILDPINDLTVKKDSIQIGDNCHVKVLSAKRLPEIFYFGEAIQFVGDLSGQNQGIHQNYAVVVNVIFPNIEKQKSALEKKRQWVIQQAYGPLLKFVPVLADKKASFDTIYESLNKGGRPLKMSYSLMVFGKTEKEVASASMAMQSFWSTLRFHVMEDRFIMLPMFRNLLPLGADIEAINELQRYKTMTSKEVSALLPLFGEWKGTGTHHVALLSRNGQLMSMSLHDSQTNKNAVIAAESGSGKSFLLNELIISYMSEGARVWVVDAGKSYKKLCESLKGDFVQFGEDSRICLNPFEMIEDWEEEEDGIVALIGAMASVNGNLTDFQVAELKRLMKITWDQLGKSMTVDDIQKACLEAEDQRVNDIGAQLYAFTSKGAYGRFFVGKNNANFKNDFTVLELDELQGRKHLRQVVLLQLIYQIQREMYLGERDRKKLLIIDEAWDLLKEGEVAVFMEHAYRKFRKYGGSAIIATQSVNDLYNNTVGRAIAENSANMFLLGQKRETIEAVKEKKYLVLSEGAFNLLRTVHTEAGVYSGIFMNTEQGQGVGRLIVSEFQKLLYSTDPVDVNAIEQYSREGNTIQNSINLVLRDRNSFDQSKNTYLLKKHNS